MTLDAKEISRIMKLCAQFGVSRFKQGDLELEFGNVPDRPTNSVRSKDKPTLRAAAEQGTIEQLEQDLREAQVGNLLIEDPEQYERLQMQGELDAEVEDAGRTESALQ